MSNVPFLEVALDRRPSGSALANLDHQESVLLMGGPSDELEVLMMELGLASREGDDKPESKGLIGESFVDWPWDESEGVIFCDGNVVCEVCSERGLSGWPP
jgi:hypothetical protein